MNTCKTRRFSYLSDSRMDRGCGTCHLWLYAGTCVEGARPARIIRASAVCGLRCNPVCRPVAEVWCASVTTLRTMWAEYLNPPANVARSMVPYCGV